MDKCISSEEKFYVCRCILAKTSWREKNSRRRKILYVNTWYVLLRIIIELLTRRESCFLCCGRSKTECISGVVFMCDSEMKLASWLHLYIGKFLVILVVSLVVDCVEKRKISYFVLARYLIQHWISPNQDDISHSARTFTSG